MDVEKKTKDILLSIIDVSESDLVPDARILGDLGATSVDVVEVIAAAENEFDIDISDEEAAAARTYGEFVALVQSKVG